MRPMDTFEKHVIAERLYALVLRLYPRAHRQTYGLLMRQAFRDSYHDVLATAGRVGPRFWLGVVGDEARSIAREHGAALRELLQRLHVARLDLASGMVVLGGGLVYVVECIR